MIYVVDSADRDRMGISKQELVSMLEEEELKNAILVVLANKQDIEGAMSVTEVHKALGLDALKNRTFQIFKASAIKGDGLDESMEWLSNALQARKWTWEPTAFYLPLIIEHVWKYSFVSLPLLCEWFMSDL